MEKHVQKLLASIFMVEDSPASNLSVGLILPEGIVAKEMEVESESGNPFVKYSPIYEFGAKANEVIGQLRKCKTEENEEIINKIIYELFSVGYLLPICDTISIDKVKLCTQKMKDLNLEAIDYDQLYSIALDMKDECIRSMNSVKLLARLNIAIAELKLQYEVAKAELEHSETLKLVGMWFLAAGAVAGLFIAGISAAVGFVPGVVAGLAVMGGTAVLGGGLMMAGQLHSKPKGVTKKALEDTRKKLEYLESSYEKLKVAIKNQATDLIKEELEKAKQALGISDQ